jgi:hypothetical protein
LDLFGFVWICLDLILGFDDSGFPFVYICYDFILGFNDNGSGIAALLEMARALMQSQCKNSHTYILVSLYTVYGKHQYAGKFEYSFWQN